MFNASARREIERIAKELDIEPAALLAVAEVESAGVALWKVGGDSLPPIRFEGHYFYRLLSGRKREKAVSMGLASPRAGRVKNPKSYTARYDLLARASQIDEDAALASTSWGVGQVMGSHWKKLGFKDVQSLVRKAKSGIPGQVEVMAAYIKAFGLVDELQSKGWQSFADQYNGPASRKNRYAQKIAVAYQRYSEMPITDAKGASVEEIQRDLKRLGYYKKPVDGVSGPATVAAIKAFQRANGLVADGKYGKMTDEAVDEAVAALDRSTGDTMIRNGTGATGTGAVVDIVNEQVDSLERFSYISETITYIVLALVVVGLGLTVYGFWKKFNGRQTDGDI